MIITLTEYGLTVEEALDRLLNSLKKEYDIVIHKNFKNITKLNCPLQIEIDEFITEYLSENQSQQKPWINFISPEDGKFIFFGEL